MELVRERSNSGQTCHCPQQKPLDTTSEQECWEQNGQFRRGASVRARHSSSHRISCHRRACSKRIVILPAQLGSKGIKLPEGHASSRHCTHGDRHSCPDAATVGKHSHLGVRMQGVLCLYTSTWQQYPGEVCPGKGTYPLSDTVLGGGAWVERHQVVWGLDWNFTKILPKLHPTFPGAGLTGRLETW